MPANFLSLPGELRNVIYAQLLVLENPIVLLPRPRHYQVRFLTLGLLRANKTVHHEASTLLYGQNRFDFTSGTAESVAALLDQIGRMNASYMTSVCIDFPKFRSLDQDGVTLEDDSVGILAKIQADCTKLNTLTISLYSSYSVEVRLGALDHPENVCEALALVDARFRTILSLQEIIVQVYKDKDGSTDLVRREMTNCGWTVRATEEYEADPDYFRPPSDIDDDAGYYYESSEEYDIDDDSDYWRRAND